MSRTTGILIILGTLIAFGVCQKKDDCEQLGTALDRCQAEGKEKICYTEQHNYVQKCATPACAKAENTLFTSNCYTKFAHECYDLIMVVVQACSEFEVEVVHFHDKM